MIVFGSRGSDLALTQTRQVAEELRARTGLEFRIEVLETRGDRELDRPLPVIGGKGLFTAELEAALRERRIDAAVHSLKDLPVEEPDDLTLGAIPERVDPRDVLVYHPDHQDPERGTIPLRDDARLGTSSPRRRGALLCASPLLDIVDLRGNVPTRIRRVAEGTLHGTLLAAAGLDRLLQGGVDLNAAGLDRLARIPLDPSRVPPAPGQGALAVQCRRDDDRVREALATLDHPPTRTAATAERSILAALGGGCSMPFGALAEIGESGATRIRAGLFTGLEAHPAGGVFIDECGADPGSATKAVIAALRPFAGEPLRSRRIAVLRPAGGDGRLDGAMRVAGAVLEGITTSEIEPAFPAPQAFTEGLTDGIVVFSSARAVDRFCEITAFEDGVMERIRRTYAVGATTADAARARGLPDVREPDHGAGGAALADFISRESDAPAPGSMLLHPGADEPHPALREGLERAGFRVTHATVYRLAPLPEIEPPELPVDAVLFTSPSAVHTWCSTHEALPEGARCSIAIGPSTAQAMRDAGISPDEVLDSPSPATLVERLVTRLGTT